KQSTSSSKGAGITPEVPDEPKRKSTGSSEGAGITLEEEEQTNDEHYDEEVHKDEESDDEKYADDEKDDEYIKDIAKGDEGMADAEKVDTRKSEEEKVNNEQAGDDQAFKDDQAKDDQAEDDQALALISQAPLLDVLVFVVPTMTTLTSSTTPPTAEVQATIVTITNPSLTVMQRLSELEKKVEALSKTLVFLSQSSSTPAQPSSRAVESLSEYELKKILFDKMVKGRSYMNYHKHQELYNALLNSVCRDEAIASGEANPNKVLRKRHHDEDQDLPADSKKEKKKRRKGKDTYPSKKSSTSKESSKGKTLPKTSKIEKYVTSQESVEEPAHMVTTDVEEHIGIKNDRLCTVGSHRDGATLPITKVVEGVMTEMPITTAEEKAQRRLEVKSRSTLMMGILNEHQLKLNSIKDAKKLLEAVKRRLALKACESAGAFRGKDFTRRFNTAHGVSTASTQVNVAYSTNIDNLSDAVICSFFTSQLNSPQLVHEDLEQIHTTDMEEMDLRRALRNQDNKNKESSKRSVPIKTSTFIALVSCDGLGGYDWSDQAEKGPNYALMAFASLSSDLEKSELMVLDYKTGNFRPLTPDLSFTGLDEFVNKLVVENCKAKSSEEEPKVVRKNDDALIIVEWVSDNTKEDVTQPKIKKKTVRPSITKIEFVKSKRQEKTARKTVKQVEQHRQNTHCPRGNQRN
nr:hypothetical protein [Tanacetum cinerariifolium]